MPGLGAVAPERAGPRGRRRREPISLRHGRNTHRRLLEVEEVDWPDPRFRGRRREHLWRRGFLRRRARPDRRQRNIFFERGRESLIGKRVELDVGAVPLHESVDGGRVHCQRRLLRPVAMEPRRRAPAQSMIELAQRRLEALEDQHGVELREHRLGALTCVEINQCVGCTRQFLTKSFLGDDAAALARSSGEEPASPRHRAGVASMAWGTTR